MTQPSTRVQYINKDTILESTRTCYKPTQGHSIYSGSDEYLVYDVIHTVFFDAGQMVTTALVWDADPTTDEDELSTLLGHSKSYRTGDSEIMQPAYGGVGDPLYFFTNDTSEDTGSLTTSIIPSADVRYHETIRIHDHHKTYAPLTVTPVFDDDPHTQIILKEYPAVAGEIPEIPAVEKTLNAQLRKSRQRVLDEEGRDAYSELLEDTNSN